MPARKRSSRRTTTRRKRQKGGGGIAAAKGAYAAFRGINKLASLLVKDKGAKQALSESLGSKLKRAWINLRGLHTDPNKGKAHYTQQKPKGSKVLTRSVDSVGRHLSWNCWK